MKKDKNKGVFKGISPKELKKIFEGIFEQAPFSIMILDQTGKVLRINEAHTKLTGLTQKRMVEELQINFRDYLKVVNPQVSLYLDKVFAGEQIDLSPYLYKVQDGPGVPVLTEKLRRGFYIATKGFTIKDENGEIAYAVLINEDCTEKKELEQMLFQAQKMESIGLLAGGIAHDFNNILSGIMGYASMLAAGREGDEKLLAALDVIIESVKKGNQLTNQLLTLARRSVVELRPIAINSVIQSILSFLGRTIGVGYTFITDFEEEPFVILGDRAQLEQVVTNLVLNARDSMPDGGRIWIEVKNIIFSERDILPKPMMAAGEYVMLSVQDEGMGISPEIIDRIFEPFVTTKPPGKGSGLGLSVVYGIVKGHGGYITVKSEPGIGSRFDIYFPRFQQAGTPERKESSGRKCRRVMVIDDDKMVGEMIATMLRHLGHEVEYSSSERDAVQRFSAIHDRVEVVILDIIMPEMDGIRVLEEIRKISTGMPVIVASGYCGREVREKLALLGVKVFLPKPFEIGLLEQKIMEAVS